MATIEANIQRVIVRRNGNAGVALVVELEHEGLEIHCAESDLAATLEMHSNTKTAIGLACMRLAKETLKIGEAQEQAGRRVSYDEAKANAAGLVDVKAGGK